MVAGKGRAEVCDESAVGRPEGRRPHARRRKGRNPGAVRAQPGPAGPTHGEQQGVSYLGGRLSPGLAEGRSPLSVPARPGRAKPKLHAQAIKPGQPGPDEGRSLQAAWKHPAAGADEGVLAQAFGPVAQGLGRKGLQQGGEGPRPVAVTGDHLRQALGVGQVETPAPGHQQASRRTGHTLVHHDPGSAAGQRLGSHETCRASTDDDDPGTLHGHGSPGFDGLVDRGL